MENNRIYMNNNYKNITSNKENLNINPHENSTLLGKHESFASSKFLGKATQQSESTKYIRFLR